MWTNGLLTQPRVVCYATAKETTRQPQKLDLKLAEWLKMEPRILCVCLLLSFLAVSSQAAVISIDFGGEWVKVALVKVS